VTYLKEKTYYKEKKDLVLQEFETARKEVDTLMISTPECFWVGNCVFMVV
jgi:hypothetical protein